MSEMLEKVEASILAADEKWYRSQYAHLGAEVLDGLIADLRRDMGDNYATLAIAAVRAIREPTDEMMAEAYCKITVHIEVDNRDLYNAWRAAIDSILSTPTRRGEVK